MPIPTSVLHVLFWLAVAVSVLGTVALPILLVRIPADYFIREKRRPSAVGRSAINRVVVDVLRNVLATIFVIAGIIMLFTPGQGLLMLLAALWMAAFPGKQKLERRIVLLPGVLAVVNKIRTKAGAPPLETPSESDAHGAVGNG